MRLLLNKKANPDLQASDGTTPLMAAVMSGKLGAATLLIDKGADVNLADAQGNTPLMIVADGGPYVKTPADFVQLLLAHGAKTGAVDSRNRTALARATENKNTAVIELLKGK